MGRAARRERTRPHDDTDARETSVDEGARNAPVDQGASDTPVEQRTGGTCGGEDAPDASVGETGPGDLYARVGRVLDANGWTYDATPERGRYALPMRLDDAAVRIFVDVAESGERERVVSYAVFPVFVPPRRRAAVADALCRINLAQSAATVGMDLDDGELHTRADAEGDPGLSDAAIDRTISRGLGIADRWFAALMAVAFGSADPAKVLEMARREEGVGVQ